jgi:hypothetical protein
MLLQQLNVSGRVRLACWYLLRFGQFTLVSRGGIGRPTLNAPPIINANAESKFASLRIALPDIIATP